MGMGARARRNMPENLEVTGIKIDTSGAVRQLDKLERELHDLDRQSERTRARTLALSGTFDRMAGRLGSLAAGYLGFQAALSAGRATIRAISEHEQLAARLDTLTGSAKAGAAALNELTTFAADNAVRASGQRGGVRALPVGRHFTDH